MNFKTNYLTLAFAILSSVAFAQSDIKYTSPETEAFKPVEVKTADALREAESLSASCGYTKAFFSKEDLNTLMKVSGCVGIRIYNAKESERQTNCDVIAVAVDATGKEIGAFAKNKYLHAESYDENTSCNSKKLSQSRAEACVKNVASSKLEYQKVFFSKSLVDNSLNAAGSGGIAVLPGSNGSQATMMIAGASLSNGKLTEVESNYHKSQLPCPTDCGDPVHYLVAPN